MRTERQVELDHQCCEKIITGSFKLLFKSARDSMQYSGAFLVAAAVSHYFFSFATIPLLTISGTVFATRLVDKALQKIPFHKLESLRTKLAAQIHDLDKQYPKLATIVLLFAIAISPFSSSLSIATGIGYGIYIGLRIENERTLHPIHTTSRMNTNPMHKVI